MLKQGTTTKEIDLTYLHRLFVTRASKRHLLLVMLLSTGGVEHRLIETNLEVNEDTVTAGVLPLHFGPLPNFGVPYPTIIIAVTPSEFEKIKTQKLKLPKDWKLGEEMPRPALDQAG